MGSPRVAPHILKVLTDNAGQPVANEVIQQITGYDRSQVQSAVARLIAVNNLPIRVLSRGALWQYDGPAAAKPALTVVQPNTEPAPAEPKQTPAETRRARNVAALSGRTATGQPRARDTYITVGMDKSGNEIVRNLATNQLYTVAEL